PAEVAARIVQLGLGSREIRACRAQGVLLVLRVEPCDHLTWPHPITDVDDALDHSSRETKGERRFVLGTNGPAEDDRHARVPFCHGDGAHRANLRRRGCGLGATRSQQHQGRRQQRAPWRPTAWSCATGMHKHCLLLLQMAVTRCDASTPTRISLELTSCSVGVDRKHLSRMGRQVLRSRNVTDEISHVCRWLVEYPDDLL